MSTGRPPGHAAVHWLTAQSFLFGAMAALLGIVANAMFLEAYGPGWLPVTYIAIGIAGVVVSGTIAQSAQRFDMMRIAVIVLGGAAVLFGIAWAIAAGGSGAWVSAVLLVLFPILIQLGFVFIGGQAGRILDIAGIKAGFARIMTGFPVGAVVGGLIAAPLVNVLGQTEDLLLAAAISEGAFAALVWATGRRYAGTLAGSGEPAHTGDRTNDPAAESSLRRLFGQRFVALILGYQVLSALGSQVADFLVFDRAAAQFPSAEDLARFLAGYTAAMNIVSIAFLFFLAGPLLRRFGLKLGITANPFVVTVFTGLMIVVLAAAGAGSIALLAVVSATRIADIALTDGTTRTSINAMYQVLPSRNRFAAQAAVEGIGVPLAIAASGVLILVLNALPAALAAMITVLAIVCAVWTWAALLLYRAYGPALVDALRHRRLLNPDAELEATIEDAAIARHLLVSGEARSAQLGLDLASTLDAPGMRSELGALADDPRPDVRLAALAGLTASGDVAARHRLAAEVRAAAASQDAAMRLRGAVVMGLLDRDDREAIAGLFDDEAIAVRRAALESIQPGDEFAVQPAVRALGDPRLAASAMGAIGRLGDASLPALATLLESPDPGDVPLAGRMVRSVTTPSPARDEMPCGATSNTATASLGCWSWTASPGRGRRLRRWPTCSTASCTTTSSMPPGSSASSSPSRAVVKARTPSRPPTCCCAPPSTTSWSSSESGSSPVAWPGTGGSGSVPPSWASPPASRAPHSPSKPWKSGSARRSRVLSSPCSIRASRRRNASRVSSHRRAPRPIRAMPRTGCAISWRTRTMAGVRRGFGRAPSGPPMRAASSA